MTISPGSVSLQPAQTQQFTLRGASGANAALGPAVTWSISPQVGSITTSGKYTAPALIANSQTITVQATSLSDPSKSASAVVTLTAPVAVSLTPRSVSLLPSQSQDFTATVTGASNTAVTWSVMPASAGLASGSTTAIYVAPSTAPVTQSGTITATSVADPSKSATVLITLLQAVTVSLSPATVTLGSSGSQQFTAIVLGSTNTQVNWSINPQVGTISSAGLYTAPPTISAPQTITVTAQSVADPTKSAAAVISAEVCCTYYVDNAGSDSNNGTSPSTPWKTIAKVNATKLLPGQSVGLNRGDSWRETLTPVQNGTASQPISFEAYGTGALPMLLGSQNLTAAGWAQYSSEIWSTPVSVAVSGMVYNGGASMTLAKTSLSALATQGDVYSTSSMVYVYSSTVPSSYYTSIEAAQRNGMTIWASHIRVDSIATWFGNLGVSVQADGISDVSLTNLDSENNTQQGVMLANVINETTVASTGLNISNSTIRNNGGHGIHYVWRVQNSTASYNTVSGNGRLPQATGWHGISMYGAGTGADPSYLTITHNTVTDQVYVPGFGEGTGIQSDNATSYETISYNIVSGNQGPGIAAATPSNHDSILFNVVVGNGNNASSGGGIIVNNSFGNVIYNNTIYGNYAYGLIFYQSTSINNTMENNILQDNGPLELAETTVTNGFLSNHNEIYHSAGGTSYMMWGLEKYNLAGWQTASSQDANTLGGKPLFTNPSGGDFTLQAGSPAVNAGVCITGVTSCPVNIGAK